VVFAKKTAKPDKKGLCKQKPNQKAVFAIENERKTRIFRLIVRFFVLRFQKERKRVKFNAKRTVFVLKNMRKSDIIVIIHTVLARERVMKIIHLSDLHLGKRVNEFSMIEDQEYILGEILSIAESEKPDAVIIAGDVYDKTVPTAEAVELLDDFLVKLSRTVKNVFVISGNHDSAERLAFGGRLIEPTGIRLSPVYDGKVQPITLTDEYGEVDFYPLPFVKPNAVRRFLGDEILSYTDALGAVVGAMHVDTSKRNVLITHQFVTGAARSDSEDVSVGGADNVDASVFASFDYVALGHLHKPQSLLGGKIRYCGSPLKYSFSEARDIKSISVVNLGAKGDLTISEIPLKPLHDVVEIKGKYADLTLKSYYENTTLPTDYVRVTLTDEEDVPNAIGKLRAIYHNIMKLDYDNARTRKNVEIDGATAVEKKSPLELFAELFEKQNNNPMSKEQIDVVNELIAKATEEIQ
jgi:exonuclease SbcD